MRDCFKEKDLISLFGEKDYELFVKSDFRKFSKWNISEEEIKRTLKFLDLNILKVLERKYYIMDNWFVFRCEINNETKYGVGIDNEKSLDFDFMKG